MEQIGCICVDGWLAPYSTARCIEQAVMEPGHLVRSSALFLSHNSAALPYSLSVWLSTYVFCHSALKLHHHQPFSLSVSLSLDSSLTLWCLHNIQLYLLQLRILIFPTRQSARAKPGEQRRGAGPADLSNLPVCTVLLTQSLHQLMRSRATLCLQAPPTQCESVWMRVCGFCR